MKLRSVSSTAIVIGLGIIVLAGYFTSLLPVLVELRLYLIRFAVILAGFAVLVGCFSLWMVHFTRLLKKYKGSAYSLLVIVCLPAAAILGIALGPNDRYTVLLYRSIQFPVEASLMALLAVSLLYASVRLLRRRLNLFSVVFLAAAILTLLGMATLPVIGDTPFLGDWGRLLIAHLLAGGGARGILIGVALGTLLTGLRVLVGADRPYGGK